MRRFLLVVAACALGALATAPALAAPKSAHVDCDADDADRNIAGCTRIAEDVSEGAKMRAIAYVGRGLAWQRKGDRARAMADFTAAIALNPRDALAFSDRGVLWRELGDVDRAIEDFTAAIALNPQPHSDLAGPGHVNIYANRALAWQAKGDLDQALSDFSQAIVFDPRDAQACFFRAQIYLTRHDARSALADLDAAIRLDPAHAMSWHLRGAVRYEQYMSGAAWIKAADLEGAIADFSEAIRREPGLALAWYGRGLAQTTNGARDRAIADLTEAVRLAPLSQDMQAALKAVKPDYEPPQKPFQAVIDDPQAAWAK